MAGFLFPLACTQTHRISDEEGVKIIFNSSIPFSSRSIWTTHPKRAQPPLNAPAYRTIMSDVEAVKLREKYTHFRILVIGRANAGKTTLLKRVCNTEDELCIYNEHGKNQVRGHYPSPWPWSTLLTRDANQLEPSDDVAIILSRSNTLTLCPSARHPRHWETVRIQEQPTIHFSRFSWVRGWERARTQRRALVCREKVKNEQSKWTVACDMVWSNRYISCLQYWLAMPHPRFCFVLNASRPLLELEHKFFNEQRAGNGM